VNLSTGWFTKMSRSGYIDEYYDNWQIVRWRGAVTSAFRGKRGQAFLKEILAALDAMPVKRLVKNELKELDYITCSHWGLFEIESVCAMGAVGKARGIDMENIDPEDYSTVANTFGIAEAMSREIAYENDESEWHETPEQRYDRMRKWIEREIKGGTK
jgi:hypothetical protein